MHISIKRIITASTALFIVFNLNALEVDVDEISTTPTDSIEFENYGGPHAVIESAAAITGIGTVLGQELALDIETPRTIQPQAKYSVIHAISSESDEQDDIQEYGLLNADIFILGETAGVDHITNLRRILTGFLMEAYGYSPEEADTVSTFLTVYNAVYRGDMDAFSKKYNKTVLQNLDSEKAGLSRNWEEWAGKTQIVIPLKDVTEDVFPVETSTISDEKVIEAMRNEPDRSIDEREKMVDMKEREITDASKKAQDSQKEAAQQKKAGDTQGAKQSAQVSKEQQKIADKKRSEIQTEKQTIAKDKEEIQNLPTVEYETGLFGADKKGFFKLLSVNALTGETVIKSSANQIRGKSMQTVQAVTISADGNTATYPLMYLAICGENAGKSAVRLCLIDAESLEIKAESSETLSDSSDLVSYNDVFFVIIREQKKNYIAAFDKSLSLKYKSTVEVTPASPLNITAHGLLVTDAKENPCMLNFTDLSRIW